MLNISDKRTKRENEGKHHRISIRQYSPFVGKEVRSLDLHNNVKTCQILINSYRDRYNGQNFV